MGDTHTQLKKSSHAIENNGWNQRINQNLGKNVTSVSKNPFEENESNNPFEVNEPEKCISKNPFDEYISTNPFEEDNESDVL